MFDWQQSKGTPLRVLLNRRPPLAGIEPDLRDS
jgi:hypothetical protein